MSEELSLLKQNIAEAALDSDTKESLELLMSQLSSEIPLLNAIWQLMDEVWDSLDCDNKRVNLQKLNSYYQHPVWLLNGFFIESHKESMGHRHAISHWVGNQHGIKSILDYGGGFGTLASIIAEENPEIKVSIFEPHPTQFARDRFQTNKNIQFVSSLKEVDCIVSTDVLEHIENPLETLYEMAGSVPEGGFLIIANCFYPVIKCHLPQTFHLRFTFDFFASQLGLKNAGTCSGSHATIFIKERKVVPDWEKINRYERFCKRSFHFLRLYTFTYKKLDALALTVLRRK